MTNNDDFFRYVSDTKSCSQDMLDKAVQKGIDTAKADKFDYKKFGYVLVSCVLTAVLCTTVRMTPLKTYIEHNQEQKAKLISEDAKELETQISYCFKNLMEGD